MPQVTKKNKSVKGGTKSKNSNIKKRAKELQVIYSNYAKQIDRLKKTQENIVKHFDDMLALKLEKEEGIEMEKIRSSINKEK